MRKKVYIVELTDEERQHLRTLIHGGTTRARMITRAQILLHADDGTGDDTIAAALHTSASTVWRIRKRFTEDGLDGALHEIVALGEVVEQSDADGEGTRRRHARILTRCSATRSGDSQGTRSMRRGKRCSSD